MFASKLINRFSSRSAATATVRAVKRRSLIPTRAALTLVSFRGKSAKLRFIFELKPHMRGIPTYFMYFVSKCLLVTNLGLT